MHVTVTPTPSPPPLPAWVICNTSLPLDICTVPTCSVPTIVNLYQVWTDISCYTLLPKWPVFGSKHRSTDHLHGNECCSSVSTGHLIVNRYTCKRAMLDICELFYTFKNYQLHIKWYQQICTIFIIPHRKHSVVQWCDIKIDKHPQTCCCSALNWIILLLRFYIL